MHPPFVICVLVLVAAAVTAGPMAKRWKLVLRKEPVPLRKRLSDLDKKRFGDYEFVELPDGTRGATTPYNKV